MMNDFSDPADERKAKLQGERVRDKRDRELEDVRWMLSSREGRRFFWRLISHCHVFETSFTGNNTTFFKEGERNIGIFLLTELNAAAPEAYALMQSEYAASVKLEQMQIEKENQDVN